MPVFAPERNAAYDERLIAAGRDLLARGDPAGALAKARAALAANSKSCGARVLLGELALAKGAFAPAEQMFREVLSARPNDSKAGRLLAGVLAHQRRFKEAVDLLVGIVRANRADVPALLDLSQIAEQTNNFPAAEAALRQAARFAPQDVRGSRALFEFLMRRQRIDDAEQILPSWEAFAPEAPEVVIEKAKIREIRGDNEGAEHLLREAVARRPMDQQICEALGNLFKRDGRIREALSFHHRAFGGDGVIAPLDPAARAVRVIMLAQIPQAWTSFESVWRALAEDARFRVTIVACPFREQDPNANNADAIYRFLETRGVPFLKWTDVSLDAGSADVVFLQSPYDDARPVPLQLAQLLRRVPRIVYVSYALEIGGGAENLSLLNNLPLHRLAWMICVRSERHRRRLGQLCGTGGRHAVVTGHPKMDALRGLERARDAALDRFIAGRRAVIWNPHFNVRSDGTEWGNGYSTFLRWHRFMPEEFARRPEMAFIVRPHPLFFDTLRQRRLMSAVEVDAFIARCEAAGNVHIDRGASYLPAFAAAAGMMSDASSFVLEFSGTGKPLLYLHNPRGPGLNDDGDFVRDHCAVAQTEQEIRQFLDSVARGEDPQGEARRTAFRTEYMHLPAEGSGLAIKEALLRRLQDEWDASIVKAENCNSLCHP